ncbi:SDR family oxidoreductase [Pseudochelatococcus sp. B33]
MDLELAKRKAVVTGASRGLGMAIAQSLASEGVAVVAAARSAKRLAELQASAPDHITPFRCDLGSSSDIEALAAEAGQTDILVINTGGPKPGEVSQVSDDEWLAQFETMFLSGVRLVRALLPGMKERRFGRILIVVSSGVVQPIPNLGVSNTIRLALVGWAKTLAAEVAPLGITVNCIAPGRIGTDRVEELDQARASRENIDIEAVRQQSRATIPVARYGDPREFAALVTFLASPAAAYITGSVMRVDGGMIRSL